MKRYGFRDQGQIILQDISLDTVVFISVYIYIYMDIWNHKGGPFLENRSRFGDEYKYVDIR